MSTSAGVGDAHSECRRSRRDGPANAPEADDPELLAPQVAAEHEIKRKPLPPPLAHETIALDDATHDAENQRPREIRRRLREDVWRVGDNDPALARGGHVDVVVAHGDRRDHLEI